jgi:thymidylate synthase
MNSEYIFRHIYTDLIEKGKRTSPRGQKSIEIENYTYNLPPYVRFTNFESRKFNLNYIKTEFLWYLRGDKFDTSIINHAKMWGNLINSDGSINSNYGQYVFRDVPISQFDNVVNQLKKDKDSRRASIMILSKDHLLSDTNDVPCTYAINFRIRKNALNMSVRMRSQDLFWGMANDAPAFSFVHEIMLNILREFYPDLEYGNYHHSADSAHVYERHFNLLEKITGLNIEFKDKISGQLDAYTEILCPKISGYEEAKNLIKCRFDDVPENHLFTKWLLDR